VYKRQSFTVAAQGFWKTILANSSFNQIAMAMAETPSQNDLLILENENFSNAYFLEQDVDAKLEIEDWMVESKNFNSDFIFEPETENSLQVENWMLNEVLFSGVENTDSPLQLESWMTNSRIWKY
jgi:hypothetical protein